MKQILEAILKELGIETKDIEAIIGLSEDDQKTYKPQDIVDKIKAGTKTALMNDDAFLSSIPEEKIGKGILKKIESGQYARFQNELLEAAKKNLGLEDKDLEDLTEEEKKSIKKTMVRIADKHLAKKGGQEGVAAIQKQLADATEALEKKDGEIETKVNEAVDKTTKAFGQRIISTLTKGELGSLDKVKLNVKPEYIIDKVLQKVAAKYEAVLQVGDDDVIHLKQKKNDALAVVGKDNKEILFATALREVVLEEKLGTEEATPGPGGKKKQLIDSSGGDGGNEDGETVVASYIQDKIDKVGDIKAE